MKTAVTSDRRTRDRVIGALLESGPSTVAGIATRLGLTPAAVRRHLDGMLADGTIVSREPRPLAVRRTRGRPARVFALSERGHAAQHNAYDDIATAALRWLGQHGGAGAVTSFAQARVADLEARYGENLAGHPLPDRARALGAALSADGYAATVEPLPATAGHGLQICQHHCPVQHVAEQFPQLCDAETEAFGRLLGTHVQRLATIAHGDGVCTTSVPLPAAPPAAATASPPAPTRTNPSERTDR